MAKLRYVPLEKSVPFEKVLPQRFRTFFSESVGVCGFVAVCANTDTAGWIYEWKLFHKTMFLRILALFKMGIGREIVLVTEIFHIS